MTMCSAGVTRLLMQLLVLELNKLALVLCAGRVHHEFNRFLMVGCSGILQQSAEITVHVYRDRL